MNRFVYLLVVWMFVVEVVWAGIPVRAHVLPKSIEEMLPKAPYRTVLRGDGERYVQRVIMPTEKESHCIRHVGDRYELEDPGTGVKIGEKVFFCIGGEWVRGKELLLHAPVCANMGIKGLLIVGYDTLKRFSLSEDSTTTTQPLPCDKEHEGQTKVCEFPVAEKEGTLSFTTLTFVCRGGFWSLKGTQHRVKTSGEECSTPGAVQFQQNLKWHDVETVEDIKEIYSKYTKVRICGCSRGICRWWYFDYLPASAAFRLLEGNFSLPVEFASDKDVPSAYPIFYKRDGKYYAIMFWTLGTLNTWTYEEYGTLLQPKITAKGKDYYLLGCTEITRGLFVAIPEVEEGSVRWITWLCADDLRWHPISVSVMYGKLGPLLAGYVIRGESDVIIAIDSPGGEENVYRTKAKDLYGRLQGLSLLVKTTEFHPLIVGRISYIFRDKYREEREYMGLEHLVFGNTTVGEDVREAQARTHVCDESGCFVHTYFVEGGSGFVYVPHAEESVAFALSTADKGKCLSLTDECIPTTEDSTRTNCIVYAYPPVARISYDGVEILTTLVPQEVQPSCRRIGMRIAPWTFGGMIRQINISSLVTLLETMQVKLAVGTTTMQLRAFMDTTLILDKFFDENKGEWCIKVSVLGGKKDKYLEVCPGESLEIEANMSSAGLYARRSFTYEELTGTQGTQYRRTTQSRRPMIYHYNTTSTGEREETAKESGTTQVSAQPSSEEIGQGTENIPPCWDIGQSDTGGKVFKMAQGGECKVPVADDCTERTLGYVDRSGKKICDDVKPWWCWWCNYEPQWVDIGAAEYRIGDEFPIPNKPCTELDIVFDRDGDQLKVKEVHYVVKVGRIVPEGKGSVPACWKSIFTDTDDGYIEGKGVCLANLGTGEACIAPLSETQNNSCALGCLKYDGDGVDPTQICAFRWNTVGWVGVQGYSKDNMLTISFGKTLECWPNTYRGVTYWWCEES